MPVLAFAGAPFTVASYLIEGRPSRDYRHTKALMHTDEALWHDVMDRLADIGDRRSSTSSSTHGAGAFQLFDSWAGALSRPDYERFVLPHSRRVFAELAARHPDAPGIHFGIGCDHLLEAMYAAGPQRDRARLAHADRRRPPAASAPTSSCRATSTRRSCWPAPTPALAGTAAVLADNAGHPGHIFNLGHGVHPDTDPGVLPPIVDLVHEPDERATMTHRSAWC